MSHEKRIAEICDFIRSQSAEPLTLASLAQQTGLSPFHFQRTFKEIVGVTPRQFAAQCRMESLKQGLRTKPATDAIYAAGFGSSSRVYESSDSRLGMTPATYGAGGKGATISYVAVGTSLGRMMVGATDRGLCFVQFTDGLAKQADQALLDMLKTEYPAAEICPMGRPYPEVFAEWLRLLEEHLINHGPSPALPLDVRATAWQMTVWNYLKSIPSGETRSYKQVAEAVCTAKAARAVARACASNRVAVLIPCHRVIRGNGDLSGYRWGVERKRELLEMERREKSR